MEYSEVEVSTINNQYMIVYPKHKKEGIALRKIFSEQFPEIKKNELKKIRSGYIPIRFLGSFSRVKTNNWNENPFLVFS